MSPSDIFSSVLLKNLFWIHIDPYGLDPGNFCA